jgi:XTP/dITP diphosphohydrolase
MVKISNNEQLTTNNRQLLVATGNAGKVRELKEFLIDLSIVLRDLNEFPGVSEVEETGATFEENAILKAKGYAVQTGIWTLADDSGLEVEALGGAPGVFSARYAGENAGDKEKITKLLNELGDNNNRRARFVCAMAIADETGEVKFLYEGVCDGKISVNPSGTNGFGYDPIFIPDGFDETFGELSSDVKQKISHRGRAMEKIIQYLRRFYGACG